MFPASLKWILCFLRKRPNIQGLASLPVLPLPVAGGSDARQACYLLKCSRNGFLLAGMGGRENSAVPRHSQTSQCEGEHSLVLGNSPRGRHAHIALRSRQESPATQTGGHSVKVNTLSTTDEASLSEVFLERRARQEPPARAEIAQLRRLLPVHF